MIEHLSKTFFLLLSLLLFNTTKAQINWKACRLPVYNDCQQIQATTNGRIYVNAGQLLEYSDSLWRIFPQQPPCEIALMSVIDNTHIYVSDKTAYQNSHLYFWNGTIWKTIKHPLANTINDMSFANDKNGILTGYGEIVLLKNGKWQHLPPPSNRNISKGILLADKLFVLVSGKGIYYYKKQKWHYISESKPVKTMIKNSGKIFVIGNNFLGELKDNQLIKISNDTIWQQINSIFHHQGTFTGVGKNGLIIQEENSHLKKSYLPERLQLYQIIFTQNNYWIAGEKGSVYSSTTQPVQKMNNWKGFKQITFNQNAKIIDDEYAVVTADFNKDGLTDIFTCGLFEEDHLYINQGNMQFIDRATEFGLNRDTHKNNRKLNLGACAGDIDNDGDMDLYVSILNGKNILYKNENGKYFIDYSKISGGTGSTDDRTNACIMGDVDNDGDLDIFIANEFSTNRLFLNNGAGIFKEVTSHLGLETQEGGNSATFADIDLDGDLDLFVTNWSYKNILYQNMLKETGKLRFENITEQANTGGLAWEKTNAVIITDMNNDSYPDIFITNRKSSNRLYINNKNNSFNNKTGQLIPVDTDESYGAVISDFDGDALKEIYVSNVGKNKFYKLENGKWVDRTGRFGAGIKGYSTGSALSDLDDDGDPDIYVANYVGTGSAILQNNANGQNFARLKLNLYQNNKNGIGSKIYLYDKKNNSLLYATEITSGSGYVSMNNPTVFIPLNDNNPTYLKIIFPNGKERRIEPVETGIYTISDTGDFKRYFYRSKNFLIRQFLDPHNLYELIKWIFVLLFIWLTGRTHQKKFGWSNSFRILISLLLILLYFIQYNQFEYKAWIYATFLPLTSLLLVTLLIHYYFERKYFKREALDKQREIKYKLSRNLHDDLAATISSTGFYLTMMKLHLKENSGKLNQLIDKAEELLQDATGTITDLIWTIRPQPETFESLLMRIQKNFKDLFEQQNIYFLINWQNSELKKWKISDTTKQNTYLILKEALNNILKYAKANEVTINIKQIRNTIEITITDNGKGFDIETAKKQGNGLQNMQTRALELPDGKFQIESDSTGSKISFRFSIKK